MEPIALDLDNNDHIGQVYDLHVACHDVDTPDAERPCGVAFPVEIREPHHDQKIFNYVVWGGDRIIGHAKLSLPLGDNTHFSEAELVVHPDHRRDGVASRLLDVLVGLARRENRRVLALGTRCTGDWPGAVVRDDAGRRFLEARGFTNALTSIDRRLDLTDTDPAAERQRLDEALAASGDYETIAWHDRVPDDLIEPLAHLNATFIAEAPMGDLDLEPERPNLELMRDLERRAQRQRLFRCGVVARHRPTGELVANTLLAVHVEPGDVAQQWMTLVAPAHRGHRLGLRVKLENLALLRKHRPGVRFVDTDNAGVNDHMVAINDILGFKPVDFLYDYQREL